MQRNVIVKYTAQPFPDSSDSFIGRMDLYTTWNSYRIFLNKYYGIGTSGHLIDTTKYRVVRSGNVNSLVIETLVNGIAIKRDYLYLVDLGNEETELVASFCCAPNDELPEYLHHCVAGLFLNTTTPMVVRQTSALVLNNNGEYVVDPSECYPSYYLSVIEATDYLISFQAKETSN